MCEPPRSVKRPKAFASPVLAVSDGQQLLGRSYNAARPRRCIEYARRLGDAGRRQPLESFEVEKVQAVQVEEVID